MKQPCSSPLYVHLAQACCIILHLFSSAEFMLNNDHVLPAVCPLVLFLQAVRGAVLDLVVELVVSSSTFIPNCMQVRAGTRPGCWGNELTAGTAAAACRRHVQRQLAGASLQEAACRSQLAGSSLHEPACRKQLAAPCRKQQ
jgi:hypothetical protein